MQIQLKILHDIAKNVFLIVTKFCSDTIWDTALLSQLKYAILQWTNKDPVTFFTCIHECHLQQYPADYE